MIIEFSVKNYRSINELQTISFLTSGLKSAEKYSEIDTNNVANEGEIDLFKTIGIYGANASGKSNMVKAMDNFVKILTKEASSESGMSVLCEPFLYQEDYEYTESFFQIVLLVEGKKYRYGITVKKNNKDSKDVDQKFSEEIVTAEWLYGVKEKNIVELFTRKGQVINNDKLPNKENIPAPSYDHTLYLTQAAAFDKKGACQIIRDYLRRYVVSNLERDHERFRNLSISNVREPEDKARFLKLLSSFNLKYNDINVQEDEEAMKKDVFPQNKIFFSKKYSTNAGERKRTLNLYKHESAGTQKMFDLAGLLLRAFGLNKPAFIIIDEIDRNFHPYLLIKFVNLFNDPSINKSQSQLLFTSHDTNLMSPSIMRRDQFYFAEKREDDSTRIYSLADLKGIRNDADFAKQYLAGYYGALPMLADYTTDNTLKNE